MAEQTLDGDARKARGGRTDGTGAWAADGWRAAALSDVGGGPPQFRRRLGPEIHELTTKAGPACDQSPQGRESSLLDG